jgi:hypothetical protein
MWPKDMFDLKRSDNSEEKLKQLVAEKSRKYAQDYLEEFYIKVDIPAESV